MSQNPINLVVRFILELAGVGGLFRLGLWLGEGALGIILALVLSIGAVAAWGTFNVAGDATRSGRAPVKVPGAVRLVVELGLLGGGAIAWWITGPSWFAWAYTLVLAVHYALSWDRLFWLLGPETNPWG